MARYGDLMLRGKSGERYCFQSWPFDAAFRAVGAVYFVTRRSVNSRTLRRAGHDLLFVGQCEDMSTALTPQGQRDALEKRGANCVCVCAVSDAHQRVRIIDDLREGGHSALIGHSSHTTGGTSHEQQATAR